MKFNIHQIKQFFVLIIFSSIIPQFNSILSFTYPQTTTLSNKNILVVEKNGIYVCNKDFDSIISTSYSFPEEDKITTPSRLSKTIIKKSSYMILILSNYKLYIVSTETGTLFYQSNTRIISGVDPEYVTLAYSYIADTKFFFIVGYIDNSNNLNIKYYKLLSNGISELNSLSFNSITRESKVYNFQNKGLSCDNIKDTYDTYDTSYTFITCFLIAKTGTNDNEFLIPITFDDGDSKISLRNDIYTMESLNVNNIIQIKTDTNSDMKIAYVCYVTNENVGSCLKFMLDNYYGKGYFNNIKTFDKNCRVDIYGMKVTYIFETDDVTFTCSDNDGSMQVYFLEGNIAQQIKYENCNDIYGYSVIYLSDLNNYYVTSDVICPEGKIPYNILIESNDFSPEVIPIIDSTNFQVESDIMDETSEYNHYNPSTELSEGQSDLLSEKNNYDSTNNMAFTSTITSNKETNSESEYIYNRETTSEINEETNSQSEYIYNRETTSEIKEETEMINNCPEKCLECNSQKECIKCNKSKNYYPIELASSSPPSGIVECITEEIKNSKNPDFYFDSITESFKPCYEKCATCYGRGDGNNNNCKTCEAGYILNPDDENSKDCVQRPNPLYYIKYGQYTVTDSERCPDDFSFLIEEKGKCIEECKKDNKYKYTYDGLCFETPPVNTNDNDGDFICKDNPDKCIVTRKKLYTLNLTISDDEIEILTKKYAKEYDYTDNHISIYENDIYIITIYKNGECISELGVLSKIINFEDCYSSLQTKIGISGDTNLIVVYIEVKQGKEIYKKNPSYGLYHPVTGVSLHFEEECKEQKISIQNNLTEEFNNSKVSIDDIKTMADQGIDLFDPSDSFYSDLCTHYPDILNKDVPLNKRALAYYPDIELCDANCELISIFLNNMTAKCDCPISNEGNNNDINKRDKDFYRKELGEFEEFIYLTNINVIMCYKDIFVYKYFIKCYGGFIILGLILIQIFCNIAYYTKSKFNLKKFIFSITYKYLNYLRETKQKNQIKPNEKTILVHRPSTSSNAKIDNPPRKIRKSQSGVNIFIKKENNNQNKNNKIISNKNINSILGQNSNEKFNISNSNIELRKNSKTNTIKTANVDNMNKNNLSYELSASDNLMMNVKDDLNIDIEDFLKTDPEDMDYDDAIRRDNRTFCRYYYERIQSEQMILNTFFNKEYLKPMPIKIMLLVLQIDLYFFINGLFYNEEYVTKIFELEEDSFSKATWRFLDNLFYAFMVGVIINYIIEFFFIQPKKLRVTLKREKNNILVLKYEMIQIIKDIEKRNLSFIIVSFIISIFTWYHISCFNNIYPHMKKEWLIFSILIIACIQLLSLLTYLLETIIRYLSFRFKSEKLFKLSLLFS